MFLQLAIEDRFYSKAEMATLRKVEKFLATADEITTMASDRVLTSYPTLIATKEQLMSGKSLLGFSKTQAKGTRTSVLTGKDRKLAVEYFKELTKPPIHGPSKCFFPRHSIFAISNSNWLDIQICYECATMSITSKDGTIKLWSGLNPYSRNRADKFFGYKSKNSKA